MSRWIIATIVAALAVGVALSVGHITMQKIGVSFGDDYGCDAGTWNDTVLFEVAPYGSVGDCQPPTDLNYCCSEYNATSGCCNSTGTKSNVGAAINQVQDSLSLGNPATIIIMAGVLIGALLTFMRL